MDELIKKLVDQVGLDPEKAEESIEAVLAFLKDKLPGPLGDQLKDIVNGKDASGILNQLGGSGSQGGIMGMLGGLFGKK
jgi:uncharacterized protein (DUF2267 family)